MLRKDPRIFLTDGSMNRAQKFVSLSVEFQSNIKRKKENKETYFDIFTKVSRV